MPRERSAKSAIVVPKVVEADEANPGSCGLQDGQHCHAAAEELESAAIGGNMLMVAGARAEEAAQFIVCATEPSGGSGAFEAPHWSVAPFDTAVVLLQPVIQPQRRISLEMFAAERDGRLPGSEGVSDKAGEHMD